MANKPSRLTQYMGDVFERHHRPQEASLPTPPTQANLLRRESIREHVTPSALHHSDSAPISPKPAAQPSSDALARVKRKLTFRDDWVPEKHPALVVDQRKSPWSSFKRLGDVVQGKSRITLCVGRDGYSEMAMFKELDEQQGESEIDVLKKVSHMNIIKLKHVFVHQNKIYAGMEFCRINLQEVLHVHLKFEERHIKIVAKSVFDAVSYLVRCGISHNQINTFSIRFGQRNAQVVLADFDSCDVIKPGPGPNLDFESLAVVLLECMAGRPRESIGLDQHIVNIKAKRSENKVFGLENAESWSGSKQLIDFLEDLLNDEKDVLSKIERPHPFVTEGIPKERLLLPFVELVQLECFTLWFPYQGQD